MKKTLFFLLCLCLILNSFSVAVAQPYSAEAKGFGGTVTVTLNIENQKIIQADIQGPYETIGVGSIAIEKLSSAMVEKNSIELDAIAGATITSKAILEAAANALAGSGAELTAVSADETKVLIREPEYTDVLAIGGGAGGLSAAIAAAEVGADVILVEKLPFLGGNSALSGGAITRAAMEGDREGDMDADALYTFLMDIAEYKADSAIVRMYVDKSAETFRWVYDNMVGSYENIARYPMIPESIVALRLPGAGRELLDHIISYAEKLSVDIRTEATGTELLTEDGKVVGAVVRYADDSVQEIYAKGGVVMATGGFPSSPELLAKYSTPGADKIESYSSAGTVGDGLAIAEKVGAAVRFNDEWDTCGGLSIGFAMRGGGKNQAQLHEMVLINECGERFVNEANIQPVIMTAMRREHAKRTTAQFWFITNDKLCTDTEWLCETQNGFTVDTLEEVSQKLNIPFEGLSNTMEAYNNFANTDKDVFGKSAKYNQGMTGPYTVFPVSPRRTTTIGGLSITTDAEVLDTQGNAISGLYATGELANYNFYYQTYTCGTALGHAIVYGRIAGMNAATACK